MLLNIFNFIPFHPYLFSILSLIFFLFKYSLFHRHHHHILILFIFFSSNQTLPPQNSIHSSSFFACLVDLALLPVEIPLELDKISLCSSLKPEFHFSLALLSLSLYRFLCFSSASKWWWRFR